MGRKEGERRIDAYHFTTVSTVMAANDEREIVSAKHATLLLPVGHPHGSLL